MVNRPRNQSCWVVYIILGKTRSVYFVRSPRSLRDYPHVALPSCNDLDGRFDIENVEPFTNEDDAIAAAVLIGGWVEVVAPREDSRAVTKRIKSKRAPKDNVWAE